MNSEDLKAHHGWTALIKAQEELNKIQGEIFRSAERTELLAAALSGSILDQSTALAFLRDLPDDVPALLTSLFNLSLSQAWVGSALQAVIAAARWDQTVMPRFRQIIRVKMTSIREDYDYAAIANILINIDAKDILVELAIQALASSDPAVREIGAELQIDDEVIGSDRPTE